MKKLLLLAGIGCIAFMSCGKSNENGLVIYAAQYAELTDPIVERFENETGINVEVIVAGTGEFVKRIEAEKNAPLADLLWAGIPSVVSPVVDLLEPYVTPNEEFFIPEYRNKTGKMTMFSLYPDIFMVNLEKAGDIVINGYEDLLNPALKGKIAMADPQKSSSAFSHVVNMLYAMGGGDSEEGWSYVRAFVNNLDGKLLGSSAAVFKTVADGEFIVGLTHEEAGLRYSQNNDNIKIVYMKEGVIIPPEGLYIIKNAKNIENAKKFVDFVTSREIQTLMENELSRRSIRTDVTDTALTPLNDINIIHDDEELVNANKEKWLMQFKELYTN
jgi:iron(III) transport system substrate-binding protein